MKRCQIYSGSWISMNILLFSAYIALPEKQSQRSSADLAEFFFKKRTWKKMFFLCPFFEKADNSWYPGVREGACSIPGQCAGAWSLQSSGSWSMLWPKHSGDDTPDKLQLECLTSDGTSTKTEVIPTSSLCQLKKSNPQAKPLGNVPRSEDQTALPWSPSEQQVAPYHGTMCSNKLRYNKKLWLYNSCVGFNP